MGTKKSGDADTEKKQMVGDAFTRAGEARRLGHARRLARIEREKAAADKVPTFADYEASERGRRPR